uniref:Uncharacterized protein n=1 Tax=Arundo donax TaxID=35708 RepID=A0A0A9HLM7_ARUDO
MNICSCGTCWKVCLSNMECRTSMFGSLLPPEPTPAVRHIRHFSWVLQGLHHGNECGSHGRPFAANSFYGSRYLTVAGLQTDWPNGVSHIQLPVLFVIKLTRRYNICWCLVFLRDKSGLLFYNISGCKC